MQFCILRMPQFSKTDQITLSGSEATKTATIAGRFFAGVTGIKEGRYFKYQNGNNKPVYAYVSAIAADGLSVSLTVAPHDITGVNHNVMVPILTVHIQCNVQKLNLMYLLVFIHHYL